MFWRKKPATTPEPKAVPTSAAQPELTESFRTELRRELEAENPDTLTAGIGLIKSGQRELTARWFDLFTAAEIYAVGVDPDTAFVFGPKEDRNYLAVFTRRDLAQQCLQEMPQLKHIMSLAGADWLRLAHQHGRGLWINPLNEACSMQFPVTAVGPLLQRLPPSSGAAKRLVGGRLPVAPSPLEPPPLPPAPPSAKPVHLAIGPSPWTWDDRSHVVAGKRYRFRAQELDGRSTSIIRVLNDQDECLLLLASFCYARLLDDGSCLLWWQSQGAGPAALEFRNFNFTALRAIADQETAARALLQQEEGVAGLGECEAFTFASEVLATRHPVAAPPGFARYEETLALGQFQPVNPQPGHQWRAIFAFNWLKGEVEVIPQDWFNKGKYDFDYAWIARVTRLENGRIAGDGVRLGRFELDATGRQIGQWLDQADGYMLS